MIWKKPKIHDIPLKWKPTESDKGLDAAVMDNMLVEDSKVNVNGTVVDCNSVL